MSTIFIYTTTTGGSGVLQKTERAQLLLSGVSGAKDRVKVCYLDVEQDQRQRVWDVSGKKGEYPLVFVGEKFIGNLEELEDANENEGLADLLNS